MRLLPQTIILRCPKISAAFALKFLTAAPYPARFFRHWRRFAGYAHQGESPDKAVQNEFRTIPSKRSWGRSTGQRLPPPRTDFHTIGHIAELSYRTGNATVGRGLDPAVNTVQGVCPTLRDPPLSCGAQKFLRHSPYNRKRAPCVERLALRCYA